MDTLWYLIGLENGGEGTDTSDATATAQNIDDGLTAYVDGVKVTGTRTPIEDHMKYWYYTFADTEFSGHFDLIVRGSPSEFSGVFGYCAGLTSVDITWPSPNTIELFEDAINGNDDLEQITFHGTISNAQYLSGMFYSNPNLATIDGDPLDLSSAVTVTEMFDSCPALEDVRFVASSIPIGISFSYSPLLSTASLMSIANGLDENATAQTLTLHATSQTACGTITVDVSAGVATVGTTKTLAAFITSDKGWTIA